MIHPTAIIDPSARIAEDVKIGPYSIIGAGVEIDAHCEIGPHVVIHGPCRLGKHNRIYQFASIGEAPQDKKYHGEATTLVIGDNNLIREHVTINRGTVQGGGITEIGNHNWIMAYVHIAHDCIVADHTIFANNASLAGHVIVDDYVILGGFTLISQFNHIGAHAFSAMGSVISKNIPPYVLVSGHMAEPVGINIEGLRRRQFSQQQIKHIRKAYKIIYRSGMKLKQAVAALKEMPQEAGEISLIIDFLNKREGGIIR